MEIVEIDFYKCYNIAMVYYIERGRFFMDKSNEIAEKIKALKNEIEKQKLDNVSAEQLAKYLVEVDRLTALMLATHKEN